MTKGLMAAGFIITASWPVNTEAEGSLHIKDKSAANSTILLACRPREERVPDREIHYWEDVEREVARPSASETALSCGTSRSSELLELASMSDSA